MSTIIVSLCTYSPISIRHFPPFCALRSPAHGHSDDPGYASSDKIKSHTIWVQLPGQRIFIEDEGFDEILVSLGQAPKRWMRDSRESWCCRQQAGGKQMSTGHLHLIGSNPIPNPLIKRKATPNGVAFFLAEDEGFEPPQTESESGVLPLHKSSMRGTNMIIL